MSRKRRMFDIEVPVEEPETFPAGKEDDKPQRRGPMATAIAETVGSTRDRARLEAEIRAENDALAQEHVRLKRAGLIVDLIPLDVIDTQKLVRDRAPAADFELAELVQSIRDIGLSNPIRVEPGREGRFELIQGWRRLSAYRQLLEETGDAETWGRIPAGIAARGDALEQLYRRMVDENMVRKDISFAEMAQLALHYAMDPHTAENDPDRAVAILFKSAGYQKRSYIRNFIPMVQALGEVLIYPQEIPRALGLTLAQRLAEMPGLAAAITAELKNWDSRTAKDELNVLRRFAGQGADTSNDAPPLKASRPAAPAGRAKTTFQIPRPQGNAKCIAANGRLEIRLPRDFSAVDRRKLEAAVAALLDQIG
ncbi:ParB N-terminal domain-containing protein [Paracoccus sp. WLY502]|uniref:ParB/RepB/Spo0J family partition protein n=1 Tax=Paracoccus yibinensis TaxID=3068891 RepID=UPI002796CC12|nr:ParB N-terminal domain-containing protein [Paracoccus sp. WLY502]MDQ1901909.1 ParB N-terminal domain-containing protein [Paracoccus sp. WLY502]